MSGTMKRTTVRLDDELLAAAKRRAADRGTTLTALIEDALREILTREPTDERREIKLPTFSGNGVRPGIDLSDNRSVRDAMDEGIPIEKLR